MVYVNLFNGIKVIFYRKLCCFMSIKKLLRKIYVLSAINDFYKSIYYRYIIDEKEAIIKIYKSKFGKNPNLNNPISFNEKVQWLKLNWFDETAIKCADKFEVRKYVEKRIGEEYLNEIYGIYEKPDEIDFNSLPDSFVLKATHASGFNIICKNKNERFRDG